MGITLISPLNFFWSIAKGITFSPVFLRDRKLAKENAMEEKELMVGFITGVE